MARAHCTVKVKACWRSRTAEPGQTLQRGAAKRSFAPRIPPCHRGPTLKATQKDVPILQFLDFFPQYVCSRCSESVPALSFAFVKRRVSGGRLYG